VARSVNAKGESEYKINDRTVSQEQYIKKLESIHILSKARNFLVFQVCGVQYGGAGLCPF
jgi:structural maintenance of chromosome 1